MDANVCDINHLDADVLLPPRKRLLAGFKKRASDANGASDQRIAAASTSSPSPSPATSSSDVDAHLNNLLSSRFNNPNLSPEEVYEASRAAAIAAAKAAKAARAAAEEKAAIAAKSIAAAKSALEMVATFSEDVGGKDRYLKKNKPKKHVPVQVLYKKHQPIESSRVDEDLAQRLHRAINSSPRISKDSPIYECKGHQQKRSKNLPTLENTKVLNGGIVLRGSPSSTRNGGMMAESGESVLDNGEAESKEKACEDTYPTGKRRGRIKLKKLPLSVCSYRDRVNAKEDMINKNSPLMDKKNMGTPVWKCQDFKTPSCIEQNKVTQM
ncbi:MUTL protein, putative isoform 1 [Hibiscus syriacus]|uniref:MUTL protein, putative isoform 1 n=1 Tax=Hibiscus syriacus TaxID=106335 RepID=A0A6A2Z200_HIBSY|nr:uncharacterized protein LOC120152276 [Hibiscus syriacus]XP_039020464.1 uncharacterized protein LOC120152276 [Hibiscus syriacus]KAE8685951.1 MUTL protein, putative isoform 1 [Hibiscus syriacus]